tara:strand:+ start:115 stop:1320 length:1206 start_codon:yes stop_codon:yes gene_type:complete
MNKIYTLDDKFEFDDIELEHPNSLQGGSYFTRMNMHSSPLYIQTNPCSTKSGIVKTAKKSYCDLMFSSHDDKAIQWFENLERRCIDAIFQKKDLWFHNEMELDDIETSFTSPIRLYKSGRNYLIRCNIANTSLSSGTFKCYDEHTNPISLDKLDNTEVKIIPLLEVQGIRFTSKNFTLELALKQVMVIEAPDFMNECFIQPGNIKSIRQKTPEPEIDESKHLELEEDELQGGKPQGVESPEAKLQEAELQEAELQEAELKEDKSSGAVTLDHQENETPETDHQEVDSLEASLEHKDNDESKQLGINESPIQEKIQDTSEQVSSPTLLDEVTLDYNNLGNEPVKLKSPEEVYYDLWYEARTRAKLAREEAIKAYLEAKNIKNTYMLDNLSDSEDELEEYLEK